MKNFQPTEAGDVGTAERHRQSKIVQVSLETERLLVAKALIECVLDRYKERAQISDRQHEAGMRLRQMWRAAVLEPSTIGAYGDTRGNGTGPASMSEARKDLGQALLAARLGKRTADWQPMVVLTRTSEQLFAVKAKFQFTAIGHVVVAVCGLDEWAGGTQRLMSLREGLSALANHWNLS